VSDAVSINVLDAFNKGGAGVNNQGSSRTVEVADNVDFNIGRKHAMRVGALFQGGQNRNFDARNAAGTFTFSSLEAYNDGTPLQFTQRNGEVDTRFTDYELGLYWQDDIRVNRNFSFSVGARQEMQSLIDDKLNVMPRLGFSWNAPKKLTVRGGYGTFYDWYDTSLYDQTLRVNGVSQRDLLILNPGYPIPFLGADTVILPGGRVQAAPALQMPYIHQASIGVERAITQNLQTQVSYQMLRGRRLMRSVNINAPGPDGVRPEPNIGTVTQFESTGRSQSDRLTVNMNYRVPNRRIFMGGNYTLGQVRNHADSATALPANSLDPNAEWGPSFQDVRHRLNAQANFPFFAGTRINGNINAQSAAPFTITTGIDNNLDGVVNDRPVGVGRNTARGTARVDVGLRVSRNFTFGQRGGGRGGPVAGGGPGGGGRPGAAGAPGGGLAGGAAPQFGQGGAPGGPGGRNGGGGNPFNDNGRFSAEVWISANNLLNSVNYLNYVGNQLSPYYLQPTSAAQARRIEVGMNFRF
jgi:hypothetical protein